MSTVPFIAPDGSVGDIPAERAHEAIQAGGKLGVNMTAPDGSTGIIPMDRVHEAIAGGGRLMGAAPAQPPVPAALQQPQSAGQAGSQLEQAAREGTAGEQLRYDLPEQARSAEMASPAAPIGKVGTIKATQALASLKPSEVEAARVAAGKTIGNITQAIKNAPVDVTKATGVANEARELAAGGATLPKVLSNFLDRIGLGQTPATPTPVTFGEARAFGKTAGRLSVSESQAMTDEMKYHIKNFAKEVGDSLKQTAQQHGFEPQYSEALRDYSKAKDMQQLQATIKKWGIGTILGALGTGAAGYVLRKGAQLAGEVSK